MKEAGYITFHDVECIILEDLDKIYIVPKVLDDIKKLRPFYYNNNFSIEYQSSVGLNRYCYIESSEINSDYGVELMPQYKICNYREKNFTGLEITGDAIDDFFQPVKYISRCKTASCVDGNSNNLLYSRICVDQWTFKYSEKEISVSLFCGNVLSMGLLSDLKVHSKLQVKFPVTSEIDDLYRIYLVIIRFLKLVRYDNSVGMLRTTVFSGIDENCVTNGYLIDYINKNEIGLRNFSHEYSNFKPFISKFLQFAADNSDYDFRHFISGGFKIRGKNYTILDFLYIFGAFEQEFNKQAKKTVATHESLKQKEIKEKIIEYIEGFNDPNNNNEVNEFICNAKGRISQLGTQMGQTGKIVNAYEQVRTALDSSLKNIFFFKSITVCKSLEDKQVKKIANYLADTRGKITHGCFDLVFSDEEAQKIRFLEILTYALLLRRLNMTDEEIEKIIGAVFMCNYVLAGV